MNKINLHLPTEAYTAAQVAAMDRYTIDELGVDLRQLMEVAGLRSAEIAARTFGDGKDITVLAGRGGNGGDALVCAKWLKLWGYNPCVLLSKPFQELSGVTLHQFAVWGEYGGAFCEEPSAATDGIVDGLIGYSLQGDPTGRAAELIDWANDTGAPVVALDVPSGLDATTGEAHPPTIKAVETVVYGVMKKGLLNPAAQEYAGNVTLVDIGFPREFPEHVLSDS